MARVPTAEVDRLKREISVERLVESHGVVLKRRGANLVGLCPFHDDKEPSLVVTPSKNLWNCLGACRSGGTAIDWVMQVARRRLPARGRADARGPALARCAARRKPIDGQAAVAGRR